MGDGIGLRAGRFEAEPEESAHAAFARALEAHGEVLLTGERLGRQRADDLDRFARLDGTSVHEFRLIRIGGDGLIFFDGVRVASVPVDVSIKDIGFFVQCVGMTVTVEELNANELVSP